MRSAFGCGTGVVVVQIGEIEYKGKQYAIPHNPLVKIMRDAMTGIHRGKLEYEDWSYVVPEWDGPAREHDMDGQKALA